MFCVKGMFSIEYVLNDILRFGRQTCICCAKSSITPHTHSFLGISMIYAAIAALSSAIGWGLFSYTLSFRYPHR